MVAQCKVGLEIHGYIATSAKLFCNCATSDAKPNTNICPICTGQPGSKPMLTNNEALKKAIQIGLLLGCKINSRLLFQRKHYSWPDSPNNYQRTMSGSYAVPVGEHGEFEGIRITEVHLEEDPAKWDPLTGEIDYNRAGLPLIEIVTEPDFRESEEVREWLKKLITTLSYIEAIDKDSGIKSDVNVSIPPLFERVEIKNVNSQSAIVDAIEIEVKRQGSEKALGKSIPMQTRTYDSLKGETVFMRSKESAMDYMFIPEPDIPYIDVSSDYIDALQKALPETPSVKYAKLIAFGVKDEDAKVLCADYPLVSLFEKLSSEIPISILITFLRRELVGYANYHKLELSDINLDAAQIRQLLLFVKDSKLSDPTAKEVFRLLLSFGSSKSNTSSLVSSFDVNAYLKEHNLFLEQNTDQLKQWCLDAIAANPKAVTDYKGGSSNALNFLVGQVMKVSKGKVTPQAVGAMMESLLVTL
jgi:aspartyl-tRNA(Asn)/glutamyl-tRNA(Gln) amidotransferase subunit B